MLDVNLPGDTGWDLLRRPALKAAGSPPVVITSAGSVSPKRLAEFGCAGWLPKAISTGDAGRHARPPDWFRGSKYEDMTDLHIVLILLVVVAVLAGYVVLVERVR